ncbi:MAG: cytochrome P450 [Halioglobus sp.]|nr:cytochrome P450 [Halioglobus sp.]
MANKTPNHALSPMACPVQLSDVDLFGQGCQEHWYEAYPILHEQAPVQVLAGQGINGDDDAYVLTCYEDIERVVKDPERFTPVMSLRVAELQAMLDRGEEPPRDASRFNLALDSVRTLRPTLALWRAHRQELTDPWVGPGAKRHSAMITAVVDELIDNWIDRDDGDGKGSVEFIAEFARPLPQIVTANVLGFPLEDVPRLAEWGSAQVMQYVYGRGHMNLLSEEETATQAQRLDGFADYLADQVASKRANPADDMISALTQIEYRALGRKLTDDEVYGIIYFMVLGGLETTQYALEEEAQLLCEQPGVLAAIQREPDKIRAFTEEAMRLRAPTQGLSTRVTTRDEVFQGVAVPAGSILHIRFGAGNVDPRQYECPYELDLQRKALGNHLTFSQGPRTCPGAGISRLEQLIAWQRLSQRLRSLEYAPGNTFEHQPGIMLGTLKLDLRFTKAPD